MKKQINVEIGFNQIIITAEGDSDTYYVEKNPHSNKFFYRSEQGLNSVGVAEYASIEQAIKQVKISIANN